MVEPKQCRAIKQSDGERCKNKTFDSTEVCDTHREYFKTLLESEVLHCADCPLGGDVLIKDDMGQMISNPDAGKRCSYYKQSVEGHNGLCYKELATFFTTFDSLKDIDDEITWSLKTQKKLTNRFINQNVREGIVDTALLARLDTYQKNMMDYAKFKGMVVDTSRMKLDVNDKRNDGERIAMLKSIFGKEKPLTEQDVKQLEQIEEKKTIIIETPKEEVKQEVKNEGTA